MEDNHNEELQALTQLVSYQLAINILPFDKKYSEFIHYGLQQVVRTSKCRVCLFFTEEPVGDTISESCKKCDFYKCSNDEHKCDCLLFNEKDIVVIPIQTVRKSFGYIALNNSQKIKPTILASIRNFANVIAITIENKLQKEELSKQNSMFNTLLKNLHIGVYMIEVPSGKPLLANEASFNLLGRGILPEAHSSTITKVYDLYKTGTDIPYPNEDLPLVVAMSGVSKHVDDMDVMKPDGTRTALEVFGSPIRDEKGNIWASLVSFQDITERKKKRIAIRESEEKFSRAVQFAPFPIMIHAENGKVLAISQGWTDSSGYTLDDIPTIEEWTEHAYGFRKQVVQKDIDALYNMKGSKNEGKYTIICKDSTERIWDFSSAFLGKFGSDGRVVISMAKDVTERNQAE